jgi:hypothetical protein
MEIKIFLYGEEQEFKKNYNGDYWFLVTNK